MSADVRYVNAGQRTYSVHDRATGREIGQVSHMDGEWWAWDYRDTLDFVGCAATRTAATDLILGAS